ncbi:hypothetical protein LguiA_025535 [Lonicera macranthoides]
MLLRKKGRIKEIMTVRCVCSMDPQFKSCNHAPAAAVLKAMIRPQAAVERH